MSSRVIGMRAPLTSKAVHEAISEFDKLGREAFLRTYGFGTAKDWPAAGFLGTEIRCFVKPEVAYAAKTIWA